ncbi:MAG: DNA-processing protein DprA [Candidatus Ancillula sp.]|nr:DNA-processing protein DprA [Candidatus Ancillula sp.]
MNYNFLDDELNIRVVLSYLAQFNPTTLRRLVKNYGAFETYRHITSSTGGKIPNIQKVVDKWKEVSKSIDLKQVVDDFVKAEGTIIIPSDKLWPKNFQYLGDDEPIALFALGNCEKLDEYSKKSVSLVGSRVCTNYGREVATNMASELGDMGYAIVSGGAIGIDISAHIGALNSRTKCGNIAFMPSGILRLYPKTNDIVFRRMLQMGGVFLAEYPGNASPKSYQFLERNRLIAAFSNGTVVVEASWRSGAISTANWALKYNKPLGVVPGMITAPSFAGCHQLIRECNATTITCADDVDEMCLGEFDLLKAQLKDDELSEKFARKYDNLSSTERDIIYEFRKKRTQTVDELASVLYCEKSDVLAQLARLQLSGLVESLGDNRYTRKGDI